MFAKKLILLIHHLEVEVSVPISVQSAEHVVAEAHRCQTGREEGRELGPLLRRKIFQCCKNICLNMPPLG